MEKPERATLDISISEVGYGRYRLDALSPILGQFNSTMNLRPDERDLQWALEAMRAGQASFEETRRVGRHLYNALLAALEGFWYEFRERGRSAGELPLMRLTIVSPDLPGLPWEAMLDERDEPVINYLSLVRYQSVPAPVLRPQPSGPLRLLLAGASPSDFPAFDLDREIAMIRSSLQTTDLRVDILDHASRRKLHAVLVKEGVHLLHFIGHAFTGRSFMKKTEAEEMNLVFENAYGESELITENELARLLAEQPMLRLLVLDTDPVTMDVPAKVIRQGAVQAVLSYQFKMDKDFDSFMPPFWNAFYTSLAQGNAVDQALFLARRCLLERPGLRLPYWASPVLTFAGASVPVTVAEPPTSTLEQLPLSASPDQLGKDLVALVGRREALVKYQQSYFPDPQTVPAEFRQRLRSLDEQIAEVKRKLN